MAYPLASAPVLGRCPVQPLRHSISANRSASHGTSAARHLCLQIKATSDSFSPRNTSSEASTSSSGFSERASSLGKSAAGKAQEILKDAQTAAAEFAENARLQEKAQTLGRTASTKLKETYDVVEDNVRRTAAKVDKDFKVKEKAQEAGSRLKEQAQEVDSRLGIRRKLRNAAEDAQRKWPVWQRQVSAFLRSPLGKVAWVLFFSWLVYTGILLRVVSIVILIGWLSPILVLPFVNAANRKAAEQARQQARARAGPRAQQRQQPFDFGEIFRIAQQRRAASQKANSSAAAYQQEGGPIIDAEWTTIDEADSK